MNLFRNYEHSVQCKGACTYAWVCVCVCLSVIFMYSTLVLPVVLPTQLFKTVTSVKEFSYVLNIYQGSCPILILWQRNIAFTHQSATSLITSNKKEVRLSFFCFLLGPWLWHYRSRIAVWDFYLVSVASVMLCDPHGICHALWPTKSCSQHLSTLGAFCMVNAVRSLWVQ
jgi:hypothetical protein